MIGRTPEVLNPDLYGLNDPDRVHDIHDILHTGQKSATLKDLVQILEDTYCGPLTAEFLHLPVSPFIRGGLSYGEYSEC